MINEETLKIRKKLRSLKYEAMGMEQEEGSEENLKRIKEILEEVYNLVRKLGNLLDD
jgi:hypothetical protein